MNAKTLTFIAAAAAAAFAFGDVAATLTLADGSVIKGTVKTEKIEVESVLGTLAVPVASLRSAAFSQTAAPKPAAPAAKTAISTAPSAATKPAVPPVAVTRDWLTFQTQGLASIEAVKVQGDWAALLASEYYSDFWREDIENSVLVGQEIWYSSPFDSVGSATSNKFDVWAKLDRTTGEGVVLWRYTRGIGHNGLVGKFTKEGNVWRRRGPTLAGHPGEVVIKDDGSSIINRWGALYESIGNNFISVEWKKTGPEPEPEKVEVFIVPNL